MLQPICYEGAREQYRYKLDELDWEDVLLEPVSCFEFGLKTDAPPPPYEDIFAIFPFVYMTIPVDGSWDDYLQGKDFTQLRRLGYMDASVDTPAYQLATRLRLAVAYRTNPRFQDYLETVEARKAMMFACVKRIHTNGIKCANAENTRGRDPQDVKDWLRRDVIASWKTREASRTDTHRYMEEQLKPAVAYFEKFKTDSAPPNSRIGLLPEARQINIHYRRLRTRKLEVIILVSRLESAISTGMPRIRAVCHEGVQLTNFPPAYGEKRHANPLGPPPGPSGG